ncbi:A.superbus venom factor 1 like protein [Argiope bruennichi]|uniref:A.superbus venom factor 1 like protein n=1 Tax=Argiope bruennichi TaxID=94029 RepID=A0A8T0EH15_ARGBR|nr:A.superbus venom factor 1 like protein [Argiope bruennichi]
MHTLQFLVVLCFELLSIVNAEIFHVVTPKTLRLDTDERIAIALEGRREATVSMLIQDHPGRARNISYTVLNVFSVPITNEVGYVFLQTDKPIYKPREKVFVRIISLNEDGLPSDKPFKLQIRNPINIIVDETIFNKKLQRFPRSFVDFTYEFPNYPRLGEWSATVLYGHELDQNTTVHFELQEYVLPTFTVDLKTPEVILESHDTISLSVSAKYVYGRKVTGLVTFRVGIKRENARVFFFGIIGPTQLREGFHQTILRTDDFVHHKDIGWFPGIEGSYLVVEARVMDNATGNSETVVDDSGRFSSSPFVISFNRCHEDFKPGLISILEAEVNYVEGTPAAGIRTQIKALADDAEPLVIFQPTAVSDKDGKVLFELYPQVHHNNISITVETIDPRKRIPCFGEKQFQKLKVGSSFDKIVQIEPPAVKHIYYLVVSKGKILKISKLHEGNYKVQKIQFRITHEMVPSFRLVVWAHYNDELIADSLRIDTENSCNPESKVSLTPDSEWAEPGSYNAFNIRGKQNTVVGLFVVDEAVYTMSKKDLLTKSKIFETMRKHDQGCGPGGGLTTDAVLDKAGIMIATNKYTPNQGSSSCTTIKREIADERAFSRDAINRYRRDVTGEINSSRVLHKRQVSNETDRKSNSEQINGMEEEIEFIPISEEELYEGPLTVRENFTETLNWYFQENIIGPGNKENVAFILPPSITTWVVQAVSISRTHGICVAEPQKIVSFKKIFVQLNLPYSMVRNQQVEIPVTVFNYGTKRLSAVVYMYPAEGLCTGMSDDGKSERKRLIIENNSAATVTFPVVLLKTGTFDIKVVALTVEGGDVIVQKLNVEAEGDPVEVDIPLWLDPSNQTERYRQHIITPYYEDSIDPDKKLQVSAINLTFPNESVRGTENSTITATGYDFGPLAEPAFDGIDDLLLKFRHSSKHNPMIFATVLYIMRFLRVSGKTIPETEEEWYEFIRQGYRKQISFRKEDGSYAAYPHRPTSTWLTAFITKLFCQASELVQIDEEIMCSGVRWLIKNQEPNGSYLEMNPTHHLDMMLGVEGKAPLTAFVLITLEECKCKNEHLSRAKNRSVFYLEDHLGNVNDTLAAALIAYSLSLSDSALRQAANDELMSMAKRNEDNNFVYWKFDNQVVDIEATSYGLLSRILQNDTVTSNSIVNWLNTQHLQSDTFTPTQVNTTSKMLLVNTVGHGAAHLRVKLRYNVLRTPDKRCEFDVSVNASVLQGPDLSSINRTALGDEGMLLRGAERIKRQAGSYNSELIWKVSICARYLGNKNLGLSIIDIGIFSGFIPHDEDLRKLQEDPQHEIERYETYNKGIVFYLREVPNDKPYCFEFRVTQLYYTELTRRSSVKIYDYYNPDEACTIFYSTSKMNPKLSLLCDGLICQCAEGGCPPRRPFENIKTFQLAEQRERLMNIACTNYDYVWKGKVMNDAHLQNGFFNISFEIDDVIKEGTERTDMIEGETRHFFMRDDCSPLLKGETYLIMGKDGETYKSHQGKLKRRYLLDQSSAVHLWTPIRAASDKILQRYLNAAMRKLKTEGPIHSVAFLTAVFYSTC